MIKTAILALFVTLALSFKIQAENVTIVNNTSYNYSAYILPTCVSRTTMIDRAQVWVDKHVPYNQGGTYDGYRTDCSGYVSMAWELSKPGLTTQTMHTVAHNISKSQLEKGDALNCDSEHIVLFGGWSDSSQTHYIAYEETKPGEGTVRRVTPYPYWYNTGCFHPIRYNNVC